jgi:hypothetical protein
LVSLSNSPGFERLTQSASDQVRIIVSLEVGTRASSSAKCATDSCPRSASATSNNSHDEFHQREGGTLFKNASDINVFVIPASSLPVRESEHWQQKKRPSHRVVSRERHNWVMGPQH